LVSAGIGNTLGAIINYFIGEKGVDFLIKSKKISPKQLYQTNKLFDRYGGYSLLLSWLPIIGDPITLLAGVLKYELKKFIFIVMVAKFGRYGIIILSYYNFMLL
jgi:membrane protein YqaA with SNARE-associated domain